MTGLRSGNGATLAVALAALTVLANCSPAPPDHETAPRVTLAPESRQSGYEFLTEESQRLQDDPFENPGYLWVDAGKALFSGAPGAETPACANCHGETGSELVGAAARYPVWDTESGGLLNLEGRINQCRQRHQAQPPLDHESEALLSLTAFVANLSVGVPMDVTVSAEMETAWRNGEAYFHTRRGQLNLACSQCHTERWGMMLRGDTISQGHGNGFPTYRLAWQTLGSLHRRFRDCDLGVRAEPHALGSDTYLALELYLATRADDLPMESPSIRR